jgi:hypothetical protein
VFAYKEGNKKRKGEEINFECKIQNISFNCYVNFLTPCRRDNLRFGKIWKPIVKIHRKA